MNMFKKTALALFASAMLFSGTAMADSPLTSTEFTAPYADFDIVQKAAADKAHVLTNEQAGFLASANTPAGARAALVNALSWNTNGQNNAALFINYLQNKDVSVQATQSVEDILVKADAEVIALYAYLLAMDNYMEVDEADYWADVAVQKKPQSLTVNMISALIQAQMALDDDWCKVYQTVDDVRNNMDLNRDLKEQAISSIFDYIEAYQTSCP